MSIDKRDMEMNTQYLALRDELLEAEKAYQDAEYARILAAMALDKAEAGAKDSGDALNEAREILRRYIDEIAKAQ